MSDVDEERDGLVIRAVDLRTAKVCLPGFRAFIEARGHDWRGFVRDGIPAAALAEAENAICDRIVAAAAARAARERGDG